MCAWLCIQVSMWCTWLCSGAVSAPVCLCFRFPRPRFGICGVLSASHLNVRIAAFEACTRASVWSPAHLADGDFQGSADDPRLQPRIVNVHASCLRTPLANRNHSGVSVLMVSRPGEEDARFPAISDLLKVGVVAICQMQLRIRSAWPLNSAASADRGLQGARCLLPALHCLHHMAWLFREIKWPKMLSVGASCLAGCFVY